MKYRFANVFAVLDDDDVLVVKAVDAHNSEQDAETSLFSVALRVLGRFVQGATVDLAARKVVRVRGSLEGLDESIWVSAAETALESRSKSPETDYVLLPYLDPHSDGLERWHWDRRRSEAKGSPILLDSRPHPSPEWPASNDSSRYEPLPLNDDIQDLVDELVGAFRHEELLDRHPALDRFCSALEISGPGGVLNEHVFCAVGWVHAVPPWRLTIWAEERLSDSDATSDEAKIIGLRELLDRALQGDSGLWGDEYDVYAEVPVEARGGGRAVLACVYDAAGTSIEHPITWIGVFRSPRAFRSWLRRQGYFTGLDQFDSLTAKDQLRMWGS